MPIYDWTQGETGEKHPPAEAYDADGKPVPKFTFYVDTEAGIVHFFQKKEGGGWIETPDGDGVAVFAATVPAPIKVKLQRPMTSNELAFWIRMQSAIRPRYYHRLDNA